VIYVVQENGKPDKKPAKVDKEKKAKESQDKSRSIMANFFAKPKPIPKASRAADPTANHSEFERTFKPFVLKKDAERAPINCFLTASKGNARGAAKWAAGEVIIIEDAGETCVIDVDLDTHPVELAKLTHQGERYRSQTRSQPIFLLQSDSDLSCRLSPKSSDALGRHAFLNTRPLVQSASAPFSLSSQKRR
jgi:hypothetical protein